MAAGLKDEHEKYQKFVDELSKLSQGSSSEASSAAQEYGRTLIDAYAKDLTVTGLVSAFSNWQPDTPEEVETLEMCLRVCVN